MIQFHRPRKKAASPTGRATKPKRGTQSPDPSSFPLQVGRGTSIAHYQRGQRIYAQGDSADSVHYLQHGKVKITVHSRSGKEALLPVLGPGEFFGTSCLSGLTMRMAGAVAMTDCSLMRIDIAALRRALRDDPEFSERFVSYLLRRGLRIHEELANQLLNSTEKRLARALLRLANFGRDGQQESIIKDISQAMLAGMVGTTRPRISHFMNKFRRLGLIDYDHGAMQIHNSMLHFALRE